MKICTFVTQSRHNYQTIANDFYPERIYDSRWICRNTCVGGAVGIWAMLCTYVYKSTIKVKDTISKPNKEIGPERVLLKKHSRW